MTLISKILIVNKEEINLNQIQTPCYQEKRLLLKNGKLYT